MKEETGYMSRSLYESCVSQLSEIGIDTLWLHFGGESLLHPDFKDFLKYAINERNRERIGQICWVDNGMLFDQSISDIAIALKVDLISFSLDGIGKVNDNIRLGSKYSIIEKNIKYLVEKRRNAAKPEVGLSVCDYGKDEKQKLEIYGEWVPYVDLINLIPSILPDNALEYGEAVYKKLGTAPTPKFCHFPSETLAVSWDGKVTGCCLDYVFKMSLGDATKEPIKQIWTGSKFQALRANTEQNTFPFGSPCYKCEFWKLNFEPREESILDGKAKIEYGYIYRKVRKVSQA